MVEYDWKGINSKRLFIYLRTHSSSSISNIALKERVRINPWFLPKGKCIESWIFVINLAYIWDCYCFMDIHSSEYANKYCCNFQAQLWWKKEKKRTQDEDGEGQNRIHVSPPGLLWGLVWRCWKILWCY